MSVHCLLETRRLQRSGAIPGERVSAFLRDIARRNNAQTLAEQTLHPLAAHSLPPVLSKDRRGAWPVTRARPCQARAAARAAVSLILQSRPGLARSSGARLARHISKHHSIPRGISAFLNGGNSLAPSPVPASVGPEDRKNLENGIGATAGRCIMAEYGSAAQPSEVQWEMSDKGEHHATT